MNAERTKSFTQFVDVFIEYEYSDVSALSCWYLRQLPAAYSFCRVDKCLGPYNCYVRTILEAILQCAKHSILNWLLIGLHVPNDDDVGGDIFDGKPYSITTPHSVHTHTIYFQNICTVKFIGRCRCPVNHKLCLYLSNGYSNFKFFAVIRSPTQLCIVRVRFGLFVLNLFLFCFWIFSSLVCISSLYDVSVYFAMQMQTILFFGRSMFRYFVISTRQLMYGIGLVFDNNDGNNAKKMNNANDTDARAHSTKFIFQFIRNSTPRIVKLKPLEFCYFSCHVYSRESNSFSLFLFVKSHK